MTVEPKIKIAIVDDHQLFRDGIATALRDSHSCRIIGQYENGSKFTNAILGNNDIPDIVLLDIQMPVMDGFDTCKFLKENYPEIKVLMLSMSDAPAVISRALQSGARGYLTKNISIDELEEAILAVFHTGFYVNELTRTELFKIASPADRDHTTLSERELQFIKLCCSELTFAEIAKEMYISPRTIEFYRASLYTKLNVKSRTGLVIYAIRHNLVTLEKPNNEDAAK